MRSCDVRVENSLLCREINPECLLGKGGVTENGGISKKVCERGWMGGGVCASGVLSEVLIKRLLLQRR